MFVAFLLILSTVNATARAQVRLNMEMKNATLQEVFRQITRLTGYEFVYSSNELSGMERVSVKAENMELSDVLTACLEKTHLWFLVEEEIIVISPKLNNPTRQQQAQRAYVAGKVVGMDGKPLPGTTVQVKGTTVGTITDGEGRFRILLPEGAQELLVTFIGMKGRALSLKERPASGDWLIVLEEDLLHLDDVIVTGYQNISRHELTGSAVKIEAAEVMQGARFSISQMLEGAIAGMAVTLNSGEPSATPKIRIRGTSSILGNKAPLWVLDGVILDDPATVQSLGAIGNLDMNGDDATYLIGNAIAGINPQDIESINVLKDAAAAAIYGVQAANGVIVIATKKGRAGKPRISYNGNATLSLRESYGALYLMNAAERIKLSQDIIEANLLYLRFPKNLGYEGLYYGYMNKDITYEEFERGVKEMAERNTDWYDLLFRDAVSHNHTVSMSGGNEHATYYGSLGYTQNEGTPKKSVSKRYTAMLKLNARPFEKLFVNLQLNTSMTENQGFHSSLNPDNFAYTTSRTIPAFNADGSYYFYDVDATSVSDRGPYTKNILFELENTGQSGKVSATTAKLDLQWDVWNGFRYEFGGSIAHTQTNSTSWATEFSDAVSRVRGYVYGWAEENSDEENSSMLPFGGMYAHNNSEQTAYTVQNKLGFNRRFNDDHVVSAQAISEIRSVVTNGFGSTAYGWYKVGQFVDPLMTDQNWTRYRNSNLLKPTIVDNTKNYVSWIGLASYSFKNKLIASFNIRADGSNQFGENPEYRFLPVWSIGGKYNITEETFLKETAVSYLALRASFGLQGNVDKNTSPDLVSTIGKLNPDIRMRESSVRYYPNPDLRWEKTESYNAGLDVALWEGRFSGTFDLYKKMTSDLIMNKDIAQVNGSRTFKINGGGMSNSGFEANVTGSVIREKDWEVGLGVIYSFNRNKLTKANDMKEITLSDKLAGNALVVGETIGTLYSYHFAGLDHDTGLPLFYDMYGESTYVNRYDEVTPNFSIYEQEAGLVKSGLLESPHTGSLQLSLRYKGFRLKSRLTYALGGVKRLPNIYSYYGSYQRVYDPAFNITKELNDRWKQPGDEEHTNIPALYDASTYESIPRRAVSLSLIERSGTLLYDSSSARTASTDHLRMNNINLSYMFDDELLKKLRLSSVLFTFETTNLFLIADKRWHGRDPQKGANSNASLPKTFTFSASITF
ncbi:MAG: SusC/RagA family TonB-linked outer membrane protein [Odoribacteraceae bacterium]|nr:SusC/RagA family TonB-linked outer membrane protein [Odoribacteraceae bacterium]